MADKAEDVKVAEVPEKSVREQVNDTLTETAEEPAVEADEKPTEEIDDEAKKIADGIEPEAEKDENAEQADEVEELLKEAPEDKSNVQKRIDKLTAEKKALEERLSKLEKRPETKEAAKYTDDQLKVALRKAMDDGDSDLVWDIMNYKNKQVKEELIKAYEDEKSKNAEGYNAIVNEWNHVTNAYAKYADTKVPEIYPGSHKDLNVKDATSLLYQVAMVLYSSEDPEKSAYYRQPGGQKLAVSDALTMIISRKGTRTKDSEKALLKKQLLKEKRKKNVVGSGSSGEEEVAPRNMRDEDILADVINERSKFKNERGR